MSHPTKDQLLAAMKGKKSLNGWDVTVSYDLKALGDKISDKMWEKADIWDNIPLNIDDGNGGDKITYRMKVYQPTLEFDPQEKAARLTLPVSGVGNIEGVNTTIDKGVYDLSVLVPIVGIHSWDGKVRSVEESKAVVVTPAHTVVQFPAKETDEAKKNPTHNYHLVFHFGSIPHEKWVLGTPKHKLGTPATAAMAQVKFALIGWISQHLDGLDYTIARINNAAADETSLQPKSFMFTTHGTKDAPVLTIYMKVEGGSSGSGETAPNFFHNPPATGPIATGFTASIIISHELMASKFIEAGLKADHITLEQVGNKSGDSQEDGFRYHVKLKEQYLRNESSTSLGWFTERNISATETKLEDHPIDLRIVNGEAKWTADFDTIVKWNKDTINNTQYGRTKMHFHVNKTSNFTLGNTEVSGSGFNFASSDIHITTSAESGSPGMGLNRAWTMEVPPELKDLSMDFKEIKVPMHKLNFLLTENIFASKGNLIELDHKQGIMTPHDVLLLGNVKWTTS